MNEEDINNREFIILEIYKGLISSTVAPMFPEHSKRYAQVAVIMADDLINEMQREV